MQLARLLHERLLVSRTTAGAVPTPWEELDLEARELNLSAVDAMAGELLELGYRMVEGAKGHPLRLGPEELERLAEAEHERWSRVRLTQGWQPGTERDDAERVHPDLVPWAELGAACSPRPPGAWSGWPCPDPGLTASSQSL
ncbi:MAG TPA: RyR domain-containing protein [Gaiellaceae bacterium]|nr:RyR domain-containing protein [Gaiellaceae bacterium]